MIGRELLVSESTFSEHHNSDLKYPTLGAQRATHSHYSSTGPDSCRDVWSVPHTPNLTAGHCELWPLVFKKKETVSWIAASYHCHSCLNLQEQEEMQKESAPTTPASLSTCRSCYRNANLPRRIILQHRFTSVLTENIYNHPRLLLLCVSAKAGPAWGQHSSNLTEEK